MILRCERFIIVLYFYINWQLCSKGPTFLHCFITIRCKSGNDMPGQKGHFSNLFSYFVPHLFLRVQHLLYEIIAGPYPGLREGEGGGASKLPNWTSKCTNLITLCHPAGHKTMLLRSCSHISPFFKRGAQILPIFEGVVTTLDVLKIVKVYIKLSVFSK